jgi:peptidoglycan/LPS O-acetylase OafA/YrhL
MGFLRCQFTPGRILSAPWLVVLGEASFGLYLFHAPMGHLFGYLGLLIGPLWFGVYLGASIGVSVLSFYYFETPTRRWILNYKKVPMTESVELASDAQ